jgi:D-alanyl-D-alanine carboxypeptidase
MAAGSVGKTFVAALALELVDAGKLDLEAPIATYLGDRDWLERLPNCHEPPAITVRMLMNHTSGLVRYEFDPRFTADLMQDPFRTWAVEEQLAYLFDREAPFPAGERFEYSDTNYLVLGLILESLTGEPLFDSIRERWIEPLGLEGTIPSAGRRIPGLVQGHVSPNDPLVKREVMLEKGELPFDPAFEGAGGGWASTSGDLARWARHLWREIDGAIAQALFPTLLDGVPAPALGAGARYGLGVILREDEHGLSLGHSGYFPGYLTEIRYWPELDLSLAIQINSSRPAALRHAPGSWVESLMEVVTAD